MPVGPAGGTRFPRGEGTGPPIAAGAPRLLARRESSSRTVTCFPSGGNLVRLATPTRRSVARDGNRRLEQTPLGNFAGSDKYRRSAILSLPSEACRGPTTLARCRREANPTAYPPPSVNRVAGSETEWRSGGRPGSRRDSSGGGQEVRPRVTTPPGERCHCCEASDQITRDAGNR